MTRDDRGVLYGMAIGDGHISLRQRLGKDKHGVPKYEYTACELIIAHSPAQRDYLQHKADMLHCILGGKEPTLQKVVYHVKDKEYGGFRVARSNTYFRQMHRVLYATGQKAITRQVLDYLTPHSVALWFMDDGSMRCNRNKQGEVTSLFADICTHCPIEDEALLIKDWFDFTMGIPCKVRPSKGKFDIGFNTRSCHRLADLVWPYVIPSMEYKFRHLHDFVLRTSARQPHFDMTADDIVRPRGN